jgi:hypothetical protein
MQWLENGKPTPKTRPGYRATKHLCIAQNDDGTWSAFNVHGMAGLHFHLAKQAYQFALALEDIGINWNIVRHTWPKSLGNDARSALKDVVLLYAPLSAYGWERLRAAQPQEHA